MNTTIKAGAGLLLLTTFSQAALLTDPNDPRVWQGADIGTFTALYYGSNTLANRTQLIADGLLDDSIFTFAGASAATLHPTAWSSVQQSTGFSTGVGDGNYAYSTPGGTNSVASNGVDNLWIQTSGIVGDSVWDLGAQSLGAVVFNTIDHGPMPGEAIESSVYLSNTPTGPWTPAVVERVWLEGFLYNPNPALNIQWDGFAFAVGTGTNTTFRYASIIHGGPGALINDGDDEINGIVGVDVDFNPTNVPEGGATIALLGISLAAMGLLSRKLKAR